MSTRGTVTVKEEGLVLVRFYNHSDSYPTGLGRDIAEFIMKGRFVNGISGGKELEFNGAGCFAAALVTHIKDGSAGGVYLIPKAQEEDFNYTIDITGTGDETDVRITVKEGGKAIFQGGRPEVLLEWLKSPAAS